MKYLPHILIAFSIIMVVPAYGCDDLEEISWRDYTPCMSAGDSKNWCLRRKK